MADTSESTVVGESILITGNLRGEEDLTVLGRVEGTINLSKTLIVAESGILKAEINVRDAVVSGIVVGNITATDSIQLTETGRMVGNAHTQRFIITPGARMRGTVDMGDLDAPRASAPLPPRSSVPAASRSAAARPMALPPRRQPQAAPAAARPPATVAARPPAAAAAARPQPTSSGAGAGPAGRHAPMLAKKIKKKVVHKKSP